MAAAATSAPEPPDGENLLTSPFSKDEWAVEYPVDIGYDVIGPLFDSPTRRGLETLSSKLLLATAFAMGDTGFIFDEGPE